MYSASELQDKYHSLLHEAQSLASLPQNSVQHLKTLLSNSVQEAVQFDELYHGQITSINNLLQLQYKKLTLFKRQEQESDDWNFIRAKHITMQRERQKQLRKTIQILEKRESEVRTMAEQYEEENKDQNMAEVEFKVKIGNQQKRHKFGDLSNRTKHKGTVEVEMDNGVIKMVVEKKNQDGIRDLVEYQARWQADQGRFVPAKEYPSGVMKVVMDYNFHRDVRQLQQDLSIVISSKI